MRWWKRIVATIVGWWRGPLPDRQAAAPVVSASFSEAYATACERVRLTKDDPVPLGLRLVLSDKGTKTLVDPTCAGMVVVEGQSPDRPVVAAVPLLYSPWGSTRTQQAVVQSDARLYAMFTEAELDALVADADRQTVARGVAPLTPGEMKQLRAGFVKAQRPLDIDEIAEAAYG